MKQLPCSRKSFYLVCWLKSLDSKEARKNINNMNIVTLKIQQNREAGHQMSIDSCRELPSQQQTKNLVPTPFFERKAAGGFAQQTIIDQSVIAVILQRPMSELQLLHTSAQVKPVRTTLPQMHRIIQLTLINIE